MKLFVQLNQEKKATIILVTHDPEMIPYCTRLIQIRDGAIMEDKELNR
jgi:putative ABC transport system ATP-binding protein